MFVHAYSCTQLGNMSLVVQPDSSALQREAHFLDVQLDYCYFSFTISYVAFIPHHPSAFYSSHVVSVATSICALTYDILNN